MNDGQGVQTTVEDFRCVKCGAGYNAHQVRHHRNGGIKEMSCGICGKITYNGLKTARNPLPKKTYTPRIRPPKSPDGLCLCGCGRPVRTPRSSWAQECKNRKMKESMIEAGKRFKERKLHREH